jgi:hypothetical protein
MKWFWQPKAEPPPPPPTPVWRWPLKWLTSEAFWREVSVAVVAGLLLVAIGSLIAVAGGLLKVGPFINVLLVIGVSLGTLVVLLLFALIYLALVAYPMSWLILKILRLDHSHWDDNWLYVLAIIPMFICFLAIVAAAIWLDIDIFTGQWLFLTH